jgi:hypothetical protein
MKYARYEKKIVAIIEQELGFTPTLDVRFMLEFEQIKIRQKAIDRLLFREYLSHDEARLIASQLNALDRILIASLAELAKNTPSAQDFMKTHGNLFSQSDTPIHTIRWRLINEIPVLD